MRVLVCGGRNYGTVPHNCPFEQRITYAARARRERFLLRETLDVLDSDRRVTCLIHGAASGAAEAANLWAAYRGIQVERYPAAWKALGRAAGPIRNQKMIEEGNPDLVVAFPGGRGTEDMVSRARAAGVEIMEVERG